MDGFRIPTSQAVEEVITDEMLDQIAAELERDMEKDDQQAAASNLNAATRQHQHEQRHQMTSSYPHSDDHTGPLAARIADGGHNDDDQDEITSDDSGDFVFFTTGVKDADVYDLVRNYIAYSKRQEKELQELEEACAALEEEQRGLWTHAVSATATASPSGGASPLSAEETSPAVFDPAEPSRERIDPVSDAFGDTHLTTTRPCAYMDPKSRAMRTDPFRYGTPSVDVGGATFSSVFKTGFLFMAEAPDGSWVFFNDSEKYQMSVKYIFGEQSSITPGAHAHMRVLPNGEREVSVMVMPEETEVLVRGSVNGFRNVSVAQPIDANFVNTRVKQREHRVEEILSRVARRLKKASVGFVTPEEALSIAGEMDGGFMDPSFPPLTTSLYRPHVDEVFLWALPWRQPAEYLSDQDADEVRLFRGQVHPIDASPGDGGDYYLCSAASIAAEYPMKVRALFQHPVSVEAGKAERRLHAYRVTLNTGGWWSTLLVDDYLPASKKGPDYGRCQHDLRKLWYPLLEKAYAKAHNSYSAIQFGDPLEALQDLLGFPTCRFDEEWTALLPRGGDEEEEEDETTVSVPLDIVSVDVAARDRLLGKLATHLANGFIVLLSAPEEGPAESMATTMGFAYGMSYAVRRVVHEEDNWLLEIRCTTMSPGWQGMWCPGSPRWATHSTLRKLCEMRDGEDAVYDTMWLDWSEALQMFDGGGVCHTRFSYEDYRVRGHFAPEMGPSVVLEVTVKGSAPLEAYCLLSQEDDRGTDANSANHSLNPLMVFVTRSQSEHVQSIDAVCSPDPDTPADKLNFVLGRDVALWYRFEPSEQPYYVIPRGRAITTAKTFTLGLLTNMPIDDERVTVRCVALKEDTPILRNKREFRPSDVIPGKPTAIQHRRPDGLMREQHGISLAFPPAL